MIHSIHPGFYCGPTAVQALTGADMFSVIIPALNRAEAAPWLQEEVLAVNPRAVTAALNELGYSTGMYKNRKALGTVFNWRDRFPQETILLYTPTHCLVVYNTQAYDNHTPMGKDVNGHPFSQHKVVEAYLIRRMKK